MNEEKSRAWALKRLTCAQEDTRTSKPFCRTHAREL